MTSARCPPWDRYRGGFAGPDWRSLAALMVARLGRRVTWAIILGLGAPLMPRLVADRGRHTAGRRLVRVSAAGMFSTFYLGKTRC